MSRAAVSTAVRCRLLLPLLEQALAELVTCLATLRLAEEMLRV